MNEREETLKVGFTQKERELLALLFGSIAGGVYNNPLHIRDTDLDGRDTEIRDFLTKLYPIFKTGVES